MSELKDPSQPTLEEIAGRNQQIALAQLTLLMRIYDVQMALLTDVDEDRANEVYALHENGHTYNPPIYLVDVEAGPEDPDEPSS